MVNEFFLGTHHHLSSTRVVRDDRGYKRLETTTLSMGPNGVTNMHGTFNAVCVGEGRKICQSEWLRTARHESTKIIPVAPSVFNDSFHRQHGTMIASES